MLTKVEMLHFKSPEPEAESASKVDSPATE
jgi:hypothetical protein